VELGVSAAVDRVRELNPDAVIVATGARVHTPVIPGCELPHVYTGAQMRETLERLPSLLQPLVVPSLLRAASKVWMPLGHRVVIIGADLAAVELAEFIARRGRRVHLLETASKIAPEVGKKRRAEHMDRLDRLHVTLNTRVEVVRIESGAVLIRSSNGTERQIAADHVIIAGHPTAATDLADQLATAGFRVKAIGDCTGLGLIAGATRDALEAVAGLFNED
jgi:2,4-dienoyl-CoA reductase (NADPH2)